MNHVDILAKFLEMFPQFHSTIKAYSPSGMNTIIVEFRNNTGFPCKFTYYNDHDWSFVPERGNNARRYYV